MSRGFLSIDLNAQKDSDRIVASQLASVEEFMKNLERLGREFTK